MTDSAIGCSASTGISVTVCMSDTYADSKLKRHNRPHSLDLSCHSDPVYSKTKAELSTNVDSKTNSLPLPLKRREFRKYSLQSDEPPPRHLLGPKPARFKTLSAESKLSSSSDSSKLSMEITPILEVSKNVEVTKQILTKDQHHSDIVQEIPMLQVNEDLSEDKAVDYAELANDNDDSLSDVFLDDTKLIPEASQCIDNYDKERQMKFSDDFSPESTDFDIETKFNKATRFRGTVNVNLESPDAETNTNVLRNIDSDIESQKSVPVERSDTDSQVDIISESSADTVATVVEIKNTYAAIDSGDIVNTSDVRDISKISDARDILNVSDSRGILKVSNSTDILNVSDSRDILNVSDARGILKVSDSRDILNVSGARNLLNLSDAKNVLNLSEEKIFAVHNRSLDSLHTYELLASDRNVPATNNSNRKLSKEVTNKISKESTQRLSKNIASEITDFFRSSASKLKPPCLDLAKKDLTPRKLKIDDSVNEVPTKILQPLVPRSPYITPLPAWEPKAVVPRKSTSKQPPFYVWNINSKNAAVCNTLPPAFTYRLSANDESKILKDFENSTRKVFEWNKRTSVDSTTRLSSNKTADMVSKSASTGELASKSQGEIKMSDSKSNDSGSIDQLATKSQRDSKMSTSQSNILNLKQKSRLFSSKSKTVAKPRSPNRLLVPKASKDHSPSKASSPRRKDFKISIKSLPKITIPLPSPLITVAKVKTQLPCDFKSSGTKKQINKPSTSTSNGQKLPGTVVTKPRKRDSKSLCKKWRSLMNLVFKNSYSEFSGTHNRTNTWPLNKKYSYKGEDLPKYRQFK